MTEEEIVKVRMRYMTYLINEIRLGQNIEFFVMGYSMIPTICPKQRVRIVPIQFSVIVPDDIIAYKLPRTNWITVHRVLEIISEKEKRSMKTKGDNMSMPDTYEVEEKHFLGILNRIFPLTESII